MQDLVILLVKDLFVPTVYIRVLITFGIEGFIEGYNVCHVSSATLHFYICGNFISNLFESI